MEKPGGALNLDDVSGVFQNWCYPRWRTNTTCIQDEHHQKRIMHFSSSKLQQTKAALQQQQDVTNKTTQFSSSVERQLSVSVCQPANSGICMQHKGQRRTTLNAMLSTVPGSITLMKFARYCFVSHYHSPLSLFCCVSLGGVQVYWSACPKTTHYKAKTRLN